MIGSLITSRSLLLHESIPFSPARWRWVGAGGATGDAVAARGQHPQHPARVFRHCHSTGLGSKGESKPLVGVEFSTAPHLDEAPVPCGSTSAHMCPTKYPPPPLSGPNGTRQPGLGAVGAALLACTVPVCGAGGCVSVSAGRRGCFGEGAVGAGV